MEKFVKIGIKVIFDELKLYKFIKLWKFLRKFLLRIVKGMLKEVVKVVVKEVVKGIVKEIVKNGFKRLLNEIMVLGIVVIFFDLKIYLLN